MRWLDSGLGLLFTTILDPSPLRSARLRQKKPPQVSRSCNSYCVFTGSKRTRVHCCKKAETPVNCPRSTRKQNTITPKFWACRCLKLRTNRILQHDNITPQCKAKVHPSCIHLATHAVSETTYGRQKSKFGPQLMPHNFFLLKGANNCINDKKTAPVPGVFLPGLSMSYSRGAAFAQLAMDSYASQVLMHISDGFFLPLGITGCISGDSFLFLQNAFNPAIDSIRNLQRVICTLFFLQCSKRYFPKFTCSFFECCSGFGPPESMPELSRMPGLRGETHPVSAHFLWHSDHYAQQQSASGQRKLTVCFLLFIPPDFSFGWRPSSTPEPEHMFFCLVLKGNQVWIQDADQPIQKRKGENYCGWPQPNLYLKVLKFQNFLLKLLVSVGNSVARPEGTVFNFASKSWFSWERTEM